jgi:hypothetical protein
MWKGDGGRDGGAHSGDYGYLAFVISARVCCCHAAVVAQVYFAAAVGLAPSDRYWYIIEVSREAFGGQMTDDSRAPIFDVCGRTRANLLLDVV